MRIIDSKIITEAVSDLCVGANIVLRSDALFALKTAFKKEKNQRAKNILEKIIENASIAKKEKLAICQDTGLPSVFVETGQDVKIKGDLRVAINKGIEDGYKKGYLRNSVIRDPLVRGKSGFAPGITHFDIVK